MKIKTRTEPKTDKTWPFPVDKQQQQQVVEDEPDWFEEVLRRTTEGIPDQNWVEFEYVE